jgi:hypothetical protein
MGTCSGVSTASVRRAANGRWVEAAGRAGLAAKGGIYLIVGFLALQIPLGLGGQPADRQGALQSLAGTGLGKATLIALAIGFAGYALWRIVQAAFDRDHEGRGAKGIAKRAGHLGKGLLYAGSAFVALAILVGARQGGSDERQETAQILGLPFGRWLVIGAGLAFLGAGAFNGYRSVTRKFREHLREHELGPSVRSWAVAFGVVGHAARAVVFGLIGLFLLRAAIRFDPDEAVGLDGALLKLAQQPYGRALLGGVAAGLLAYGLFCFVQARCRRV